MSSNSASPARQRFAALPSDAPRDQYFCALRDVLAEYYLADPKNPYQQSGRSSGAARWEESRRCIAEAIHRDGDFMDVGCANGLLLESLVEWAGARGHSIRPHGIDFIPELIRLARQRHPTVPPDAFEVANAFYWDPSRRYDWVRTELVYVPAQDQGVFAKRLYDRAVASGGRLVVCHYRSRDEPTVDVGAILESIGGQIAGRASAPGVDVAWVEKPA